MASQPQVIVEQGFQEAWESAVRWLAANHWEWRNLLVQTRDPTLIDATRHTSAATFFRGCGVLSPKDVAYTIFPHALAERCNSRDDLFRRYNRSSGLYERLMRRGAPSAWGTYFRRMTHYGPHRVNQLEEIVTAVRSRRQLYKAAYTVLIAEPGSETTRPIGAPCLNYVAVQIDTSNRSVGLLAIYRNHDFLQKAYGNYWGLCNLLRFLADETGLAPGPLTCLSSHAYVGQGRAALGAFVGL
jgi:hypothetical protein